MTLVVVFFFARFHSFCGRFDVFARWPLAPGRKWGGLCSAGGHRAADIVLGSARVDLFARVRGSIRFDNRRFLLDEEIFRLLDDVEFIIDFERGFFRLFLVDDEIVGLIEVLDFLEILRHVDFHCGREQVELSGLVFFAFFDGIDGFRAHDWRRRGTSARFLVLAPISLSHLVGNRSEKIVVVQLEQWRRCDGGSAADR